MPISTTCHLLQCQNFNCRFTGDSKTDMGVHYWGLTPLHLYIKMQTRRVIFRKCGVISETGSCLNWKKIDILYRRYPELLLSRNNMTMKFHFYKKNLSMIWTQGELRKHSSDRSTAKTSNCLPGSFIVEAASAEINGPKKNHFRLMTKHTSIWCFRWNYTASI